MNVVVTGGGGRNVTEAGLNEEEGGEDVGPWWSTNHGCPFTDCNAIIAVAASLSSQVEYFQLSPQLPLQHLLTLRLSLNSILTHFVEFRMQNFFGIKFPVTLLHERTPLVLV